MLMDDLYDAMKTALGVFGLRFSEMNKVQVILSEGVVSFSHEGIILSYTVKTRD